MRTLVYRLPVILLVALAVSFPGLAQFGKNKITYGDFDWKVYPSPHFEIHYYTGMEPLLEDVVNEFESAYLELSRRLDHELRQRIPVIIYRTHRDFQQTNVVLFEIPEAVGAFAEPFQKRMVLPIDDPPDKRYKLIRHELTHVFQYDVLYGDSIRRSLRGSPPLWLMEGMASYLGDDEDSFDQMVIRDAVVNNLMPSVRQLDVLSFLTYRYGHAIMDFIAEEWGSERIRLLLFEFREQLLARGIDKVFEDSFGLDIESFDRQFQRFLRQRYLPVLTEKRSPDDYGDEIGTTRKSVYAVSPSLSPSGDLVAAIGVVGLEPDVIVMSAKDGEVIRNLTKGLTTDYENIVSEIFEGKRDLDWSPTGDELAFFVRRELHRSLMIYDPLTGRRLDEINLGEIAATASPAFSPDGRSIAFSGNRDGFWDIFVLDRDTGEIVNVTQDKYVDSNPRFTPDGERILYNRRIGPFEKIFMVEIGTPERKTQLTGGPASDLQPTLSRDEKWIYFTSDRGEFGVFNLHRLELASGEIQRLTDLVGGAFVPVELPAAEDQAPQLAYTAFSRQSLRLYRMKVAGEEVERAVAVGREEPQTSPLAPSRQAAAAERRAAEEEYEDVSLLDPGGDEPEAAEEQEPAEPEPVEPEPQPEQEAEEEDPDPADVADADLEPFRPPLELGIDEERKRPYRVRWDIDAPSIAVGVTDDGTILSNTRVTFADLLGDQRIIVDLNSYDRFTRSQVTYLNLTRRWTWGGQLFDYRDYFVFRQGAEIETRRANRYTVASAFAAWPFNRYWRVEGSAGYGQRRQDFPRLRRDPDTGRVDLFFLRLSDDFPLARVALVGDTVRYQSFGPFHGYQFRASVGGYWYTGGDFAGESLIAYELEWRGYQAVTRRSNLAVRFDAVVQDGARGSIYSVGGINQIRGLRFRELFGESYAYANLEYRFPLFNGIQWAFGLVMAPIRSFVFVDVGSAWFEDEVVLDPETGEFVEDRGVWDPRLGIFRKWEARGDDDKLRDVYASAGAGIQVPLLGLPLTWAFYRNYDGEDFADWGSDFYIVYNW
jgi:hypothetical protein